MEQKPTKPYIVDMNKCYDCPRKPTDHRREINTTHKDRGHRDHFTTH